MLARDVPRPHRLERGYDRDALERACKLRERERVSQAVFASHLNVTTGLVSQWEPGEKKPQGASLKLLSLVRENGLDSIA